MSLLKSTRDCALSYQYSVSWKIHSQKPPQSYFHLDSKAKWQFSLSLELPKYSGALWPSVKLITTLSLLAQNSLNPYYTWKVAAGIELRGRVELGFSGFMFFPKLEVNQLLLLCNNGEKKPFASKSDQFQSCDVWHTNCNTAKSKGLAQQDQVSLRARSLIENPFWC